MKIYFVLHIILLCVFMTHMFKQHDFTLIHHHIELTYMNKLITEASVKNVKPNRTYRAFDIEFVLKRDLYGDTFKLKTHCFYFLNNEYKSSPIQFDVKICDVMDRNLFGARDIAMKYGNLTAKCPLKTGHYMLHNFNVPDESLPPNLPEGEYMVVFAGFWDDNKIFEIKWFGGIRYKVKNRRRF